MRKRVITLALSVLVSNFATAASEGENQASSFANIYSSLCIKHLSNLDALRERLKLLPKLPPEKASYFLAGNTGDVWPVPDKYGTFVLALVPGKQICAVHGRRVDTEAAKRQFFKLVAVAPSPLVAKQVISEQAQTAANGPTETMAYEWSVPHAKHTMLFTLTTAPSETAQRQVLGSAAIISK